MRSKKRMSGQTIPEGFTLPLVIEDALPVLFFGGSMILIGMLFGSLLFYIGAALCCWAGAAKVIWKLIVVTKKKNIWWLFLQMRITMPIGFLLMLASVFCNLRGIDFSCVLSAILSFPSVIFFAIGLTGMLLMGIFASKLDAADVRANRIEQWTNTAAQAAIFCGILFLFR